jgi:hypothetical protein
MRVIAHILDVMMAEQQRCPARCQSTRRDERVTPISIAL